MARVWRRAGLLATVLAAACQPSPTTPPNPSPTPSAVTITITAAGANPKTVQVTLGQRVRFINNDTKDRNMGSDPHPDHTDCPPLNVGILKPGEQRETGNLVIVQTCGFHDHDDPTNQTLWGSIITK